MTTIKKHKSKALKSKFGSLTVFNLTMKVKDVLYISYVAVRGKDDEEGAVQRLLNKKRIQAIKNFILEGNMFFNTFILNWTNDKLKPEFADGTMTVPIVPSAAQIIDGQHRLAGLDEAMKEDNKIGEQEILVTFCIGLKTKEAALIFVNINSEQKPVPKSLIYDLFGEIEDNQNHAINRANDIAEELNENIESAYYGAIKFPGKPRGVGIIDLSAVVSSLKKHLEPNGIFASYRLTNLQNQKLAILNYFSAIKFYYDREDLWNNRAKNPFLTNAGFIGAIEHLVGKLLAKCAEKKSFKVDDFKQLLDLPKGGLLQKEDLKNLGGTAQRKQIIDFLESNLLKSLPDQDEYKF
jgi:DGQHR domain-containing protein